MFETGSIPTDVLGVCQQLHAAGHQAHLVGGGIRDLLLGREPADFDVATDALPDVVMQLFGARYALPTGLQHGTITVLAGTAPRHVEVTTFRGEGEYLDGRRPSSVSFSATLHEDLARRDFTMNAIAFDPVHGVLTDPFDGQGDIGRKLVKAVGLAVKRFEEDGLRPMRAVRQATVLGFEIEPATMAAIALTLDSFRKVSSERIRDELFKMFKAPRPSVGVRLMLQSGLLAHVLPEVVACVGCAQEPPHTLDVFDHALATLDALPARFALRMAGLLHDVGKPIAAAAGHHNSAVEDHAAKGAAVVAAIADRLRLSIAEQRVVCDLVALHEFIYEPQLSDADVRQLLRAFTAERIEDVVALHLANRSARSPNDAAAAQAFAARVSALMQQRPPLAVKDLAIDGKALMRALELPPGKHIGTLLNGLLDYVIAEPAHNTPQDLLAWARAQPK